MRKVSRFDRGFWQKSWAKYLLLYHNALNLVPFDSTIITLTSKLMRSLNYYQVKLFAGINLQEENLNSDLVVFGQAHDCNYGKELIECLNQNDVAIIDRGFASQEFINYCCQILRYFVVRINRNYQLYLDETLFTSKYESIY